MNLVKALVKPPEEISDEMTISKAQVLHPLLGIFSELDELDEAMMTGDRENIKEELGDILFYTTDMEEWAREEFNHSYEEPQQDELPNIWEAIKCIHKAASLLADHIKRYVIYNTKLDYVKKGELLSLKDKIGIHLNMLRFYTEVLCEHECDGIKEVILHNRAKLEERYPDLSYSDDHAHARADKE